jgi:hypothetical protein
LFGTPVRKKSCVEKRVRFRDLLERHLSVV